MLIYLSALSYILPFWVPATWPLLFFFPGLLLYCIEYRKTRMIDVVGWSVFVCIGLLFPFCQALFAMAHKHNSAALIPPLCLVIYATCITTVWLYLTAFACRAKQRYTFFIWTASLWLYFIFVEHALLLPLGYLEGHFFMNPLLPFASNRTLLAPLYFLHPDGVLLLYCIGTSTLYCAVSRQSHQCALLTSIVLSAWLASAWKLDELDPPVWLHTIGHLPLQLGYGTTAESGQRVLYNELAHMHHQMPHLQLVVLPESAWNNGALANIKELDWCTELPIENLVIGGFLYKKDAYHNALFWYHKGIYQTHHEKQHAIPFVEQSSSLCQSLCDSLYFQLTPSITPSAAKRPQFKIPRLTCLTPYICSELYCSDKPKGMEQSPLLVAVNDSWMCPQFQRLMCLAGRFRAMQWRLSILYIGYYYAQYFDASGAGFPIATTPAERWIN